MAAVPGRNVISKYLANPASREKPEGDEIPENPEVTEHAQEPRTPRVL